MRTLNQKYKVIITKLNFGEPHLSTHKILDTLPTEDDLILFVAQYDDKMPDLKHFDTIIEVHPFYEASLI